MLVIQQDEQEKVTISLNGQVLGTITAVRIMPHNRVRIGYEFPREYQIESARRKKKEPSVHE